MRAIFQPGQVWDAGARGQYRVEGAFGRGRNRTVIVEHHPFVRFVKLRALACELEEAVLVDDPGPALRRQRPDVEVPDYRNCGRAAARLRQRVSQRKSGAAS